MINDIVAWLSDDYGKSDWFTSLDEAQTFVLEKIIMPNPRLSTETKEAAKIASQAAYNEASTWLNIFDDEALTYWKLMAAWVNENIQDEKIRNVFQIAVEGAEEAADPSIILDKDPTRIKLPWWIWIIPAFLIFRRK